MRRFFSICAASALASMLWSSPARAQGTNHQDEDTHLGLGAAFNLASFFLIGGGGLVFAGPTPGASILIPIDILGVLRVEPEIAFVHLQTTDEDETDSVSVIRPGAGIFFMFALGDNAGGYVGARGGPAVVLSSDEEIDPATGGVVDVSTTRVDGFLAPAFGGEYYFNKHFSLGAEMQVAFTFIGDADTDIDPGADPPDTDDSGFIAATNTLLTARVFFF